MSGQLNLIKDAGRHVFSYPAGLVATQANGYGPKYKTLQ